MLPGTVEEPERGDRLRSRLEAGARRGPETQRPEEGVPAAAALVPLALDEIGDAVAVHVGQVGRGVGVAQPKRPVDQVLGAGNARVEQREASAPAWRAGRCQVFEALNAVP